MAGRRLLLLVILTHNYATLAFDISNETQLRSDLLTNYSLKSRPDAVTAVNLVFNIITINELVTRTQTFSVSGYFTVVWNDTRLKWDKKQYNNIAFFFSDETEIWRPSLVVRNAIDDLDVIANDNIPLRVNDVGEIYWNPPGIYKTHCDIDITYYPFDSQECSVVVQSWGYNLRELDLFKFGSGVDTTDFERNGEWDLIGAFSEREERTHDVDSETYAAVSFVFKLQRKPDYYGVNIILPVVVLSILSALVFVLPPDSGEKMGYSLTVLLSFAVFLTLIADRMPTTSRDTSYMAVYLSVIMCLSGMSVLLTIFVLDLNFREDEVPPWLDHVTNTIIMPLVCVRGCQRKSTSTAVSDERRLRNIKVRPATRKEADSDEEPTVREPSAKVRAELTWKDIARTVDALMFRIYLIIIVAMSTILFSILGTQASTSK
ncbi:neuronal acetylcholine receptor subunit alpha-6-like [Haliotis asinina]|uniref:neuronal acetylcholine receptor subunit alpha-6-like n=1 Tax=Haliotis asinina TaxID=109174 RepID=UPI003531CC35